MANAQLTEKDFAETVIEMGGVKLALDENLSSTQLPANSPLRAAWEAAEDAIIALEKADTAVTAALES